MAGRVRCRTSPRHHRLPRRGRTTTSADTSTSNATPPPSCARAAPALNDAAADPSGRRRPSAASRTGSAPASTAARLPASPSSPARPTTCSKVVALPVSFRDRAVVNHSPAMGQLESVLQEHERIGVLLADRQRARMLVFELGVLTERTEVLDAMPRGDAGHADRGDLDHAVANDAHAHLRHAAEAAWHVFQDRPFTRLAVGAPEPIARELSGMLHPYLQERQCEGINVAVGAGLEEIRRAAFDVEHRAERKRRRPPWRSCATRWPRAAGAWPAWPRRCRRSTSAGSRPCSCPTATSRRLALPDHRGAGRRGPDLADRRRSHGPGRRRRRGRRVRRHQPGLPGRGVRRQRRPRRARPHRRLAEVLIETAPCRERRSGSMSAGPSCWRSPSTTPARPSPRSGCPRRWAATPSSTPSSASASTPRCSASASPAWSTATACCGSAPTCPASPPTRSGTG